MSTNSSSSRDKDQERFALYPLSLVDYAVDGVCPISAWLVEGLVDTDKLRGALDRVVSKWPILGGRVVLLEPKRYAVRVELDSPPPTYKTYGLTSTTSPLPLAHYVPEIPLPTLSRAPPTHLFVPPERYALGGSLGDYARNGAPLTHWHLTHFTSFSGSDSTSTPSSNQEESPSNDDRPCLPEQQHQQTYTCIGAHWPHGLFDGVGFALIAHAVEAELARRAWKVPPLPSPGLNENQFTRLIEREVARAETRPYDSTESSGSPETKGAAAAAQFSILGLWGILMFVLKALWVSWGNEVECWSLVIPFKTHTALVERTREALERAVAAGDVPGLQSSKELPRLSSGDVITAWILQTIFQGMKDPARVISLSNMTSLRPLWPNELSLYPFNCIAALPYPSFTAIDVASLPLWRLSLTLTHARTGARPHDDQSRRAVAIDAAVASYRTFQELDARRPGAFLMAGHQNAQERVMLTNISAARIVDLDWHSGCAGRTVGHWGYFAVHKAVMAGSVGVNGRLHEGALVLSAILSKKRAEAMREEVNRLSRSLEPVPE